MKVAKIIVLIFFLVMSWGCGNKYKNEIAASGTIEATNVIVSAEVNGRITHLFVNEGAEVVKGATLLTIDHDLLSIQLKQAEAAREAVKAQLNLLKNGARTEDVKQAWDVLKQAEVNFNLTKIDLKRMNNLHLSNSISQKQYDDVHARFNIVKVQYNSAKENYKKIQNLARPEQLKEAEANLEVRKAAVELIMQRISDSYVTAPISGFVVKKFIEKGENVVPMTSLMMISNQRFVNLIIYVSEVELGKVKIGQTAKVSIDSFPDKTFKGKVIYISPEAEFTPKNIQTKDERTKLVFAVKIHIPNPNFDLKAGMPADAVIKI